VLHLGYQRETQSQLVSLDMMNIKEIQMGRQRVGGITSSRSRGSEQERTEILSGRILYSFLLVFYLGSW
jgi:hypothetical protein